MKAYGIKFNSSGKMYIYISKLNIDDGKVVIVPTDKGENSGIVVKKINNVQKDENNYKQIIRIATKKDLNVIKENEKNAKQAIIQAQKLAIKQKLSMRILSASYTFDKKQLQFNFLADERVDFRDLAKNLASIYKTRIELRQIGVRDKAKEVGGIGQCGRCLCCNSFLNHVGSISINTVKNQNIAINPSKINGQCGRLLCCLAYEDDQYTECQKNMPKVGDNVKTDFGLGKVLSVDILNRMYTVDIDGNKKEIKLDCGKYCNK